MKSLEELAIILEVLEDDLRTGNAYRAASRNLSVSPVHSELGATGNLPHLGATAADPSQVSHLHVFCPQEAVMSLMTWLPVQSRTLITVHGQRNTTKPRLPPTVCPLTFNIHSWKMSETLNNATTRTATRS